MTERRIYLDYNSTTPLHPRVREAIHEVLGQVGNPSSLHGHGRCARRLVEEARERVAGYLGVDPAELYFTSGGTESNNLVATGLAPRLGSLWISATEHPSLMEPARRLWRSGLKGNRLPVDAEGRLRDDALEGIEIEGGLVSIQWVNNETGVIQDLDRWREAVHARGALLHTDGAQGFFRLPDPVLSRGIDAATITAHKSFGPLGVGVLYLRRGGVVNPLLAGGPQERQVRPGTENLPAIHGLGVLAELAAAADLWPREGLVAAARRFRGWVGEIPGVRFVTPDVTPDGGAFPNTLSLTLEGLDAATVLVRLDLAGISASSGSACSSGAREPSRVLAAMGVPDAELRGALRFSWGPDTPLADLEHTAHRLARIVRDLSRRRA